MPPSKRKDVVSAESSETTADDTTSKEPVTASPSDETDVALALSRKTHDGKGDDPVPPSDFDSFATESVNTEEKNTDVLADEVLRGSWGDFSTVRDRLDQAGHNSSEVLSAVNERLVLGAPTAYRASSIQLLEQVQRGEWGSEEGLHRRLTSAGFSITVANDVVQSLKNS